MKGYGRDGSGPAPENQQAPQSNHKFLVLRNQDAQRGDHPIACVGFRVAPASGTRQAR